MSFLAWRAYLLFGVFVVSCYLLVPVGVPRDVVYVLVGVSSAAALVGAVRLHQPIRRAPWFCLAAGQLLWFTGDAIYCWYQSVLGEPPFPSPADAAYLGAYLLIALSFLLLLRGRQTHRDVEGLLDSSIFTVAFGLLSWVLIVGPSLEASDASLLARTIGLAYPLADVVLFGLLVRLLVTPGGRTCAFWLLLAGGAALFLADTGFALLTLSSSYDGGALDLLWLSAYVLWGAAALHPSMRVLSEPAPAALVRFTRGRLLLLCSPCTLLVQLLLDRQIDVAAVAVSSIGMFMLVIARMAGLLHRVQAQAGELDALSRTDALTGLPNRRSADAELGRALAHARHRGTPLSVAMLDLDRFKLFNDTYGHQAGDRLLTQAASVWVSSLHHRGVLARYGGEEFVLLAPGLHVDALVVLLEQMRQVTPAGQTFSAGVSRWDGAESAASLIQRADVALYAAKHTGRNRTVNADQPVGGECSPLAGDLKRLMVADAPTSIGVGADLVALAARPANS